MSDIVNGVATISNIQAGFYKKCVSVSTKISGLLILVSAILFAIYTIFNVESVKKYASACIIMSILVLFFVSGSCFVKYLSKKAKSKILNSASEQLTS